MNTMFKKFATGTAALALVTTVFASTAMAAEGTTTTNIEGTENVEMGTVSTTNFGTVTLNGSTQTATAQLDIASIVDARGTGNGWNVAVKATPLSQGENGKILGADSLALGTPTVKQADPGSSAISTINTQGGTIDNVNGVNILTAANSGGMGSYSVEPIAMTLTLLPKEVYEGSYSTTVSVTLTNGPQ